MPNLNKKCGRKPEWLKSRMKNPSLIHDLKRNLRQKSLHTVCESAKCPNLGECFGEGRATFMILGDVCTRECRFCAVEGGTPTPVDPDEPQKIAHMVAELGLKHVVLTSVTRDDLPDGGADHFALTIDAIRNIRRHCDPEPVEGEAIQRNRLRHPLENNSCHPPALDTSSSGLTGGSTIVETLDSPIKSENDDSGIRIEILTPDFNLDRNAINIVLDAKPDIFNHNVETVERLTASVRNKADYRRSLDVLRYASDKSEGKIVIKSGIMVGLGETDEEIHKTLDDMKSAGCQIVTIGQYLRPSMKHLPVMRYVEPKTFDCYKSYGESIGLDAVFAGPLVRSSYMAEEVFERSNVIARNKSDEAI